MGYGGSKEEAVVALWQLELELLGIVPVAFSGIYL